MESEKKPEDISVAEAEIMISMWRQEINDVGANDYEIPAMTKILEQLNDGSLSSQEARDKAWAIYDRKMKGVYH